jgi:non-specific serine/threonine protein kinase
VTLLRDASNRPGELLALFVAGVCHGFAGNSVQSTARHRQCVARADEHGERHMKALAVAGLGEQELAAGHLDEAAALFGEAIVLTRELGDRMGIAVGLDSLGRVATAQGRGSGQRLLLGAAEGIWDVVGMSETGNPFAFAPSRSDGLRGPASFWARNGSVTCSAAVPAHPRRDRPFALEADTDADPPAASVAPSPLTKRELEVADLVADGLSNPDIAARLFISVRTAQGTWRTSCASSGSTPGPGSPPGSPSAG